MSHGGEEYYLVYDVIAQQLKRLKELSDELFYRTYEPASMERPSESEKQLKELMDTLQKFAMTKGQKLDRMLVRDGIPKEIYDSFIRSWNAEGYSAAVYDLISALCDHMSQEELSRYVSQIENGFGQLNSNVQETGMIILPDFIGLRTFLPAKEMGDAQRQEEKTCSGKPANWMGGRSKLKFQNILFVEKGRLTTRSGKTFEIKNHVLNQAHWQKRHGDQLVIAFSPVAFGNVLNVTEIDLPKKEKNEPKRFIVDGLKNPELIHRKIEAAARTAGRYGADILMFPEMLGDEETAGTGFWKRIVRELDEADCLAPKLILAPSWSHERTNETVVFDDTPERLFSQQKKYPFPYKGRMEDLSGSDHNIWVLHVPTVGRVLITICKDMLEPEYFPLLLEELEPSLVLAPSFSPRIKQFDLSEQLAAPFGSFVVWGNTCAAHYEQGSEFTTVGIVQKPFGKENDGKCYMKRKCDGGCADSPEGCLFLASITINEEYTVSCEHVTCPGSFQADRKI